MWLERYFRDLPLRGKFRTITLIISGLAVIGACAVFVTYDWVSGRRVLARRLSTMGEIVADQCSAALEFEQVPQAAAILSSLRKEPSIEVATLHDRRGRLFASYVRDEVDASRVPAAPALDGVRFESGELVVFLPVRSGDERIGTFHIRSDLRGLRERLVVSIATTATVLLVAAIAILYLVGKLGAYISDPVRRLADVVRAVSERRDYSIRVASHGKDEMGALIDGFNDMLSQIEVRDEALAHARDELELRVDERTRELAASNRELEGFSYSVSHDLRAPLRAVGGYARMLVEDCSDELDETGRRYVRVILENTDRMGQLIDDLLTFSRMSRQATESRPIDMESLAQEVFLELRGRVPERGIDFRLGELPAVVGDRAMIRVVLVNLISNAIKYSRGREMAVIELNAEPGDEEVVYHVRDNGVGFDERYREKLFKVFQRLHSGDEFEGTGIGLALVERIVARHGGRVWAEGKVDAGATFSFALPRRSGGRPAGAMEPA